MEERNKASAVTWDDFEVRRPIKPSWNRYRRNPRRIDFHRAKIRLSNKYKRIMSHSNPEYLKEE
jgi:hypothetical protein